MKSRMSQVWMPLIWRSTFTNKGRWWQRNFIESRRKQVQPIFTMKWMGWNSMDVLISLVNLWIDIKFLIMWGTCKRPCKRKEEVGVDNWVKPICFTFKPMPLPIWIWLGPWYSSTLTIRFARSAVRWCVAPESKYQLRSDADWGVVSKTCMLLEDSIE